MVDITTIESDYAIFMVRNLSFHRALDYFLNSSLHYKGLNEHATLVERITIALSTTTQLEIPLLIFELAFAWMVFLDLRFSFIIVK